MNFSGFIAHWTAWYWGAFAVNIVMALWHLRCILRNDRVLKTRLRLIGEKDIQLKIGQDGSIDYSVSADAVIKALWKAVKGEI